MLVQHPGKPTLLLVFRPDLNRMRLFWTYLAGRRFKPDEDAELSRSLCVVGVHVTEHRHFPSLSRPRQQATFGRQVIRRSVSSTTGSGDELQWVQRDHRIPIVRPEKPPTERYVADLVNFSQPARELPTAGSSIRSTGEFSHRLSDQANSRSILTKEELPSNRQSQS